LVDIILVCYPLEYLQLAIATTVMSGLREGKPKWVTNKHGGEDISSSRAIVPFQPGVQDLGNFAL